MDGVDGWWVGGGTTAVCTVLTGRQQQQQAGGPPTILLLVTRCPFLPPPPPSALLFLIVVFPTTSLCHAKLLSALLLGVFFSFASREMGMGWDVEGGRVFSLNAPHYACVAPLVHDGDRQRLNRAKITCSDSL